MAAAGGYTTIAIKGMEEQGTALHQPHQPSLTVPRTYLQSVYVSSAIAAVAVVVAKLHSCTYPDCPAFAGYPQSSFAAFFQKDRAAIGPLSNGGGG